MGVAMAACAASTQMSSESVGDGSIAEVQVESGTDGTTVTLVGVQESVFTAFAQQNPEKVVVDIASTSAEGVDSFHGVGDGLVDDIQLAPFSTGSGDQMVRVEITLSIPADYRVAAAAEGLVVRHGTSVRGRGR
jgi:hypothetical protein